MFAMPRSGTIQMEFQEKMEERWDRENASPRCKLYFQHVDDHDKLKTFGFSLNENTEWLFVETSMAESIIFLQKTGKFLANTT